MAVWWSCWCSSPGAPTGRNAAVSYHETPLQVLQRRLAHGDVSPEEFEKRKALL